MWSAVNTPGLKAGARRAEGVGEHRLQGCGSTFLV